MEKNRNPEERPARRLNRRAFLKVALGASGIVLLTACTSTPSPSPAAPAVQPPAAPAAPAATKPAAAAQPTAAPAPAKVQKPVVIVQGTDPPTMDPNYHESGPLANYDAHMLDYLVNYDRDMKIVPSLAESMKMLPDGVTYQFKIRRGVKFWNGEVLDARAVKFTFDRIVDPALRKQGLSDPFPGRSGFDHIDLVDDYTVNIVIKTPNVMFPIWATYVGILAPDYYSKHTPQETALVPMGSGPWMFKEWVKDDHLTMTANPNYWMGKPEIDTLIWKVVPEASTRTAMLQTGDADVIADLSPEDVQRVSSDAKLRVSKAVGGRRVYFQFPTEKPLWKDRRVRLAMNLAIDFDAINKGILSGLAFGRMGVPVNGDFWIDPSIKPYAYDPEKAKQLLQEAGWNPNQQVTLYTPNARYMKDKEIGQAVAGYLQKVGMKAEAQTLEWSVYSENSDKSKFDMPFMTGMGTRFFGPMDLNTFFEQVFQGWQWADATQNGPQAKKLQQELMGTLDEKKQQELVFKIEQLMMEEVITIPLWKQVALFGVNRRIDFEASGNTRINLWLPGEKSPKFTQ